MTEKEIAQAVSHYRRYCDMVVEEHRRGEAPIYPSYDWYADLSDVLGEAFHVIQARAEGSPQGWQEIGTCPDVGQEVVVWNGQPWIGYYQEEEGWFADVDGEMIRIDPPPTLWLPAPPAPGSAEEGR